MPSGQRVYIGNIPSNARERDLEKFFKGKLCDMSHFETINTDVSTCYMFRGDETLTLKVDETGTDSGLHLTFNMEQYEYTSGNTKSW